MTSTRVAASSRSDDQPRVETPTLMPWLYSCHSSRPEGVGSTSMVPHSLSPAQATSSTWCETFGRFRHRKNLDL